jgi:hypothetical protein
MSYCHLTNAGISFSNGFGPQPAALILSTVNGSTCLSTDCINTCINTVSSIEVINSDSTSAEVTWTDTLNSNWEVSASTFTGEPINWIAVTSNAYTFTNLTPNTFYSIRVRPVCEFGLESANRQTVIATGANYCNGVILTDTGGVEADYTDSETYVRVLIPNLPNKKIQLTFNSFDLELDWDYLYVYDELEFLHVLWFVVLYGVTMPFQKCSASKRIVLVCNLMVFALVNLHLTVHALGPDSIGNGSIRASNRNK